MGLPRLGFIGTGWIGAMRLEAVSASGRAVVAALCDTSADRLEKAGVAHPEAERFASSEGLLEAAERLRLDGVVIATPNALHVEQAVAAFGRGLAVFCQKPLAPDADSVREVIEAARGADRLLGVDYSYRHTDGATMLRAMIDSGELGHVFSIESIFHNAYGPDKAWCHDLSLAGGGALMDLGVHQIDLPLWLLGSPDVVAIDGCAYRDGEPLAHVEIDDFALARLDLEGGARVNVAVSWDAHVGADCRIRLTCYGTRGGAELRNREGSFFDFELIRFRGRDHEVITSESRDWLGRGILAWVDRLATQPGYDPEIEHSIRVAEVIDAVYAPEAVSFVPADL